MNPLPLTLAIGPYDHTRDVTHVRHLDAGVFAQLIFVPHARPVERTLQNQSHAALPEGQSPVSFFAPMLWRRR